MSSTQKMQEMMNRGREATATLKKVKDFFRTVPLAEKLASVNGNQLARAEALLNAEWS